MRKSRSVFCLLIAITLFLFLFCLFACNEQDFYELYGEPQQIASTSDDVTTDGDGQNAADSIGEIDQTADDDGGTQSSSDGGAVIGGDTATDGANNGGEEGANDAHSGEDGTTATNQDGEEDEMSAYLAEIFDLSEEKEGLYRYVLFESAEDLPVFVGMNQVGTATLTAGGAVVFKCDFKIAERELWGAWDEEYRLSLFVRFDELSDTFRQMVYRPAIALALQLDLSEAELASLKAVPVDPSDDEGKNEDDEKDPLDPDASDSTEKSDDTGSPAPIVDPQVLGDTQPSDGKQETDDQKDTGSDEVSSGEEGDTKGSQTLESPQTSDDSAPEASEQLPQGSGIRSFWEGLGTVSDLQVLVVTAEEEEYSFLLKGSSEECAALTESLTPYLTYSNKTTAPEQYQATVLLDQKVFNLFVQITKESSAFSASVKVLGEAL